MKLIRPGHYFDHFSRVLLAGALHGDYPAYTNYLLSLICDREVNLEHISQARRQYGWMDGWMAGER